MLGVDIRAVLEKQRGKFAVLAIWFLVVFVVPLISLLPAVQNFSAAIPAKLVAKEDDEVFRHFIALIEHKDWKTAYAMVAPEAHDAFSVSDLEGIGTFTKNMTESMEILTVQFNTTKTSPILHWGGSSTTSESDTTAHDTTVYNVSYEVKNDDPRYPYAIVSISALKEDGNTSIVGFHVSLSNTSVKDSQKLDFSGTNIVLMILAVLLPLFISYSALHYLSNATNPRWVMFLVIVLLNMYVYVVGDVVNLKFGFYSFVSQTPYGSLAFIVSLPLGAIYYWIMRKRYQQPAQSNIQN